MRFRGLSAVAVCSVLAAASPTPAAIKVACVGDSITASSSRYPTWLGENLGPAYEVRNFGVSGTTMLKATGTPYWNTANFTSSSTYLPDIVIIMLGTNDSKTFNWGPYGSQYETDYRAMVSHYRGLASRPVVYLMTSPPCFNYSSSFQPDVIAGQIVPTVRRLATTLGAPLVEIFNPMSGHPEYFSDGTHPTTEGSQLIAGIVEGVIRANAVEITPAPSAVTASTSDTNVPGNTVDNSLSTRWSGGGDGAWIQYDLGTTRRLAKVGIAVYQGNARRNRFDLQVSTCCDAWTTVWSGESSGTTTIEQPYDFADVDARLVRYVGHGSSVGTFNSVTEVSLFAPLSTPGPTPTPTAAPPVTPTPTPTPTSTPTPSGGFVEITPAGAAATASTNDGNLPANAVDNNLASRWSANGDGQWLQLDLGSVRTVAYVNVATYSGNVRQARFDLQVSTDGGTWSNVRTAATSSGTTTNEETFDFADAPARWVRYLGHGNSVNAWNSVTELSVYAPTTTGTPTPTPTATPTQTPAPTPTSTPTPAGTPVEVTPGASGVTASGNDGNLPANAVDGSLASRWSANGDGQWLQLDLGATRTVTHVRVATYNGNARRGRFDVQVATTAGAWTNVLTGVLSSGTTTDEETFDFTDTPARYVRYLGHGNSVNSWNSVSEISAFAVP